MKSTYCLVLGIAFICFGTAPAEPNRAVPDQLAAPSGINSHSPEGMADNVPINQRILSRIWDESYLKMAVSQEIPPIPLSERGTVGDLRFKLNKVNRNIRHFERFFHDHQFWMQALWRELEETGIWDYLFHLSPNQVGHVYRFRQVAKALVEAATWKYPRKKFRLTMVRAFAYIGEYLTFVYEQQIYQARISSGELGWAEQPTYTEWVSRSLTAQLEGVELELLEPEGSYMRAYGHPSLDFVVKVE